MNRDLAALSKLLMTHDLTCVTGDLIDAAHRHARQGDRPIPRGGHGVAGAEPTRTLAIAAVAFTIQLAIEAGHDPAELRAIERELIASLGGDPRGVAL